MSKNAVNPLPSFTITIIIALFVLFGAFCGLVGARLQERIDNSDAGANVQQVGDHQDAPNNQAKQNMQNNATQNGNQNVNVEENK